MQVKSITPKIVGDTKVIFGPVRLSFAHVWEPKKDKNSDKPKYSADLIIPNSDKATLKAIRKAIKAAKEKGKLTKWSGNLPQNLTDLLHDGNEKVKGDPDKYAAYRDTYYITAWSYKKPEIVDTERHPIIDQSEVYSGCWCVVSVTFIPYNNPHKKGVLAGLNNLMKAKDDAKLGESNTNASTDFADVDTSGFVNANDDDDDVDTSGFVNANDDDDDDDDDAL